MKTVFLTLSAFPYFLFVGIDTWYHEKKRYVPAIEKILHLITVLTILPFFYFAFSGSFTPAVFLLGASLIFMIIDEAFYHRELSRREKRIHVMAGVSLLLFCGNWIWMISTT